MALLLRLRPRLVALGLAILIALFVYSADWAATQAVKGTVSASSPPPALTFHGLIPGFSSADDVRKALGEPFFEAPWYSYKMQYRTGGSKGLVDAVHLAGASCRQILRADASLVHVEGEREDLGS